MMTYIQTIDELLQVIKAERTGILEIAKKYLTDSHAFAMVIWYENPIR
jgi:hypothetical protein